MAQGIMDDRGLLLDLMYVGKVGGNTPKCLFPSFQVVNERMYGVYGLCGVRQPWCPFRQSGASVGRSLLSGLAQFGEQHVAGDIRRRPVEALGFYFGSKNGTGGSNAEGPEDVISK